MSSLLDQLDSLCVLLDVRSTVSGSLEPTSADFDLFSSLSSQLFDPKLKLDLPNKYPAVVRWTNHVLSRLQARGECAEMQFIKTGTLELFAGTSGPKETEEVKEETKKIEKKTKEVKEVKQEAKVETDDISKCAIVVGKVLSCAFHPDADSLLVSQIDIGTKKIQVVSGLRKYITPEAMTGRLVVLMSNLKPGSLKGAESLGMILCASVTVEEQVTCEPIIPPNSCVAGDFITFDGVKCVPDEQLNSKKVLI